MCCNAYCGEKIYPRESEWARGQGDQRTHSHGQHGQVSFVPFQNVPFTVIEPVNLLYRCVWMFSPSPWPAPLTASPLIRPGH